MDFLTRNLRTIALIAIGLVLALILFAGPRACRELQRKAAEAEAGQARSEGQVKAATDATGITANAMDAATASEALGRETADVIHSAPGARAPVDPALDAAALRRLCLRAANLNQPRCLALQRADPGSARQ